MIISPEVSAASQNKFSIRQKLQHNQNQMKNTREKIKTLKIREQQEKSKLVRNQQRLETARTNLVNSENQY
jgi:hypothetical protein